MAAASPPPSRARAPTSPRRRSRALARSLPTCVDHNAASPVRPVALRAYLAALAAHPGPPDSAGPAGRRARAALARARARIARSLDVSAAALHLTCGGSAAVAAALQAFVAARPGAHVVAGRGEHPAVAATLAQWAAAGRLRLTWVDPGHDGVVPADAVLAALAPETALIALQAASHETGALQPVAALAARLRQRGVALMVDATQAVGRVSPAAAGFGADLVAFSAHKLGAVGGLGVVYVRPGLNAPLPPWAVLDDAVALAAALAAALRRPRAWAAVAACRDRLEVGLATAIPGLSVLSAGAARLPQTSGLLLPGCPSDAMLMALDLAGFAVSAGAACSAGAALPSPYLAAMGLAAAEARCVLRLSLAEPLGRRAERALVAAAAAAAAALRAPTAPAHPPRAGVAADA